MDSDHLPTPFSFVFCLCFQQKLLLEYLFYLNDDETFGPEVTSSKSNYLLSNQSQSFYSIIRCLTSPTVLRFSVITNHLHTYCEGRNFKFVCNRRVEEIQVISAYFFVPPIFQSETLVNLELNVSQRCMTPILNTVNLPKLKFLCFSYEGSKPFDSIAILIKSCTLLETLDMTLDSLVNSPHISIVAPYLKSLSVTMVNFIDKHQVIIDAPKLTYLFLVDRGSLIDFVTDPTELGSADIDLTYVLSFRTWGMDANDFFREISKFVVHLSSVREFHLESNVNLFSYMHSLNSMPLFGNLSYATTTLTGSSGVTNFLLLMQIAPNLKEVFVTLSYEEGNNDEVNLVDYILKNAAVSNKLWMRVYVELKTKMLESGKHSSSVSLALGFQQRPQRQGM
ncbi:hypothetical protein RDABS01_023700 [Bienertia sinuspersici]